MEQIDQISLDSYLASVQRSLIKCFAPWSRMPPEVWAEEVYRLPNGRRFKWDYAPYSKAMFLSLFDRRAIETVFQLYSRGLKSTVILLAIGYFIDQSPRRILSLWPTNSHGEKWSKDILVGELLDTVPVLNYLGSSAKSRTGSVTMMHKLFPGGLIDIFGANAPGDMRRAKGSFLYAEEIDAIDSTATDEGDQLAIFDKRGDEYPDTIRVKASYPSLRGESRIQKRLEASDYCEWWSTCIKCGGEPFVMHRSHIVYDNHSPELARLECPRCKALLTDVERYQMAHKQGDCWKARNPFRGFKGFHANALLWPHPFDEIKIPGGALQMIAQQVITAENSPDRKRGMRPVVNTVDAEPFDPTEESEQAPDWKPIFERREDYGLMVPMGGLFLVAFADVQVNRIEVGWQAFGRNEESWCMDYVVLDGHYAHSEVWEALRRELARKFEHESGAQIRLGMAFVDGGAYGEEVYRFFQRLVKVPMEGVTGKCRATKGMGKHGHPVIDRKYGQAIAKNLKGHHIGTWYAKDIIYGRLKAGAEAEEGRIHFNKRHTEEYFRGATAESVQIVYEKGQEVRKYINPERARNEPLDILVGCLAAFRLHPRNFDAIEAQLIEEAEIRRGEKEKAPSMPRIRKVGNRLSSAMSPWG